MDKLYVMRTRATSEGDGALVHEVFEELPLRG
jgi:hypothetical protein